MKYYDNIVDLTIDNAITKIIRLVGNKKKVLEFGCATGYMSKVLKEQFSCDVTGVEINPELAEKAREFCGNIVVGDIENLDIPNIFKSVTFDVILFVDVLEHLKDPAEILRKVFILLKDNGYVLASIPNIAHASVIIELIKGDFRYRPLGLLDDTHIHFFTKRSIYELFEKSGFVVRLIDRVRMTPESTEFNTPVYTVPKEVIDYLYRRNEDVETYQFIVKAYKSTDTGTILKLREEIAEKDSQIAEKDKQISEKDSQISEKEKKLQRLLYSKSWRITAPLRGLYNIVKRFLLL